MDLIVLLFVILFIVLILIAIILKDDLNRLKKVRDLEIRRSIRDNN